MLNGAAWNPTSPLPKPTDVLAYIICARSSTPSFDCRGMPCNIFGLGELGATNRDKVCLAPLQGG